MTTTAFAVQAGPEGALVRARDHLISLQHPDGWWKGELQTNVTMDAEDLMLREFLGIRDLARTERCAAWIRSQQDADGSWSKFQGGPGDLSTTLEAYVALRLAGDAKEAEHMRAAAAFARAAGGPERARVFTHIWLALFGAWPWERVPALAAEMVLLPSWAPLNPYDFACWARQTIVALSVVISYRPRRPLPFSLEELSVPDEWSPPKGASTAGRALVALDRLLHVYQRRPVPRLRELALARAERWIIGRQEADGSWGGIQPPWVYSLIALHLRGYALEHPLMRRGLDGLESFTIEEGNVRRLEACQSPVWDTALALVALADSGVAGDDPAVVRAAQWLLDQQILARGDWAVKRPELEPGGWAFEFANANYPDIDDTAEVVLALGRVQHPDAERVRRAVERGARWVEGMQSSDGGWGAFDADNRRAIVRDLPFCDFGEVIDPPSADVTAHAIEMLAALGRRNPRGLDWLLAAQEEDGSWFGRWGVNHVYGTGAAVPALIAAGIPAGDERIRRAVRWLEARQNPDGGWGRTAGPTTTRPGSGAATAPHRRRPGRCWPLTRPGSARWRSAAASAGWSRRSGRMAAGTSRSTPGPAFRRTSTSTITSTGSCSR